MCLLGGGGGSTEPPFQAYLCSLLICKGKSSCILGHCHEISTSTWPRSSTQASATFYWKDLQARNFTVTHTASKMYPIDVMFSFVLRDDSTCSLDF